MHYCRLAIVLCLFFIVTVHCFDNFPQDAVWDGSSEGESIFDGKLADKRGIDKNYYLAALGKRGDSRFHGSAFGKRMDDSRYLAAALGLKEGKRMDTAFYHPSFGKRGTDSLFRNDFDKKTQQ